MNTLHAVIEWGGHNYGAYVEEVDGVGGIGDTLDEVKTSLEEGLQIIIEEGHEYGYVIPEPLQDDYRVVYRMDTRTFLEMYCHIFTKSALERLTGINQKQLWHYASGQSKPRPAQIKRIEKALHKLGEELLSVEL